MGTNFYARIIPTKKRKEELKKLIDSDSFDTIKEEIDKTYGAFSTFTDNVTVTGEIHLGKRSGGWKFLWNPNIYLIRNGHSEWTENEDGSKSSTWIEEPDTAFYVYPLTKEGIKAFIDREDVEIYDEYGELQDKEIFWKEAIEWNTWQGKEAWDSKSYEEWELKQNPSYKSYPRRGEYVDLLKAEGFVMNTPNNHDFYSDGLRFATSTDFC